MYKSIIFTALIAGVISAGIATDVWAAGFEAKINPKVNDSDFEVGYQKTIFIDYKDGGIIADELKNKEWRVQDEADITNVGVQDLMQQLNTKIANDGSQARITDLDVSYKFHLQGRELGASIDYEINIRGIISNYIITTVESDQGPKTIIDLAWRGLTTNDPVTIDEVEINMPINVIRIQEPIVYDIIMGTSAETEILAVPTINAEDVLKLKLTNWHFLFDPTGINVDANQFGLDKEIAGFVVSSWTMGESSIREGRQVPKFLDTTIQADKEYTIRSVRGPDDGTLRVIGFGAIDTLQGAEIAGITDTPPPDFSNTSTGDFPIFIIYGMAGMAAIAGIAFFFVSSRSLKNEKQGQQGIDPSHLVGYETSSSSGGYQTNRGEAQLRDASDYAQTRSVYESDTAPKVTQPASTPTVQDAACGCAAAVEMGSECDCEMQGSCLCDATCGCDSQICKEHSHSMI